MTAEQIPTNEAAPASGRELTLRPRAVGGAAASVARNGKRYDLRWALLAVIQETARHAGHADIIREQIDGQTGR
jgi:hypothetical protein